MEDGRFIIENAEYGSANHDELTELWCSVFGDSPGFVEAFFDNFGDDIESYVALDESGSVCSAITCYPAGSYEGKPVYVSYAICTREDRRGRGLARALTEYVRDEVISRGGISIVSPAEESLEEFYSDLGYEPHFHAAPRVVLAESFEDDPFEDGPDGFILDEDDDFEAVRPKADIRKTDASVYNKYREAYLAGVPHIKLSDEMLGAAELAGEGFYIINNGDAVCCVTENGRGQLMLSELIISPILQEISGEIEAVIARLLASHFGAVEVMYNTPGAGRVQSMAAGAPSPDPEAFSLPYFGFPIE